MMDDIFAQNYDEVLREETRHDTVEKTSTKVERLSKMLLGDEYDELVTEKENEILSHMSPNALNEMKKEALEKGISERTFKQKDGKEVSVTVTRAGWDKEKDAFNDGDPDFNYEITVDGKTTQVTKKQAEKIMDRLGSAMMHRSMYKMENAISTPIKEARNMGADHVR